MIRFTCRSNLDLDHSERWPDRLDTLPRVGDLIESGRPWGYRTARFLVLEVVSVTWRHDGEEWSPVVELHLGRRWSGRSINDFIRWYKAFREEA